MKTRMAKTLIKTERRKMDRKKARGRMRKSLRVGGTVLTNDGNTAQVGFPNGDKKFFHRDSEPQEVFVKMFPVGGTTDFEMCPASIEDREDLFDLLERMFGKPKRLALAALASSKKKTVLLGMSVSYGKVSIFCSPECSHPDGGKGFAIARPNGNKPMEKETAWFHFDPPAVEEALGVVAASLTYEEFSNQQ